MTRCGFVSIYPAWYCLNFLDLSLILEFFGHCSSDILSALFFWYSTYAYIIPFDVGP